MALSERAQAHINELAGRRLHADCFYHNVVRKEDREKYGFEEWKRAQVFGYLVPEWLCIEELFELCDPYLKREFYGEEKADD